ncbi:enoyl-CoA hydratase/isomerase family protein [Halalkalibacter akibai]|uniref:Enoyl-CoA hydratase n=1 Tax=Halalkalibacter akibai (strain ATCC 43226 / DSM 21942 / CIP 109018 / JCM 9157 / 1139) TaxID=1236973 RepID=W4QNZ4_HALA3|nr:enoyl-CoA hydratase [Halalkalibacter akibai]GAE33383.1 enoyl-CoA hydratase [Halalkalibacter akibai JCM 9157]
MNETMNLQDLLVVIEDGIMELTLNRPSSLNAFSPEMISGLKSCFTQALENDEVKVIVIRGAGRAFSAGGDVKTMGEANPSQVYDHIGQLNGLIEQMRQLEKPIIAAVHGFAAGAGFNLALACDLIVAAEDTSFILSFAQVGLVSDGGGHFFIPRALTPYQAKELLFTAKPLDVKKAEQWGLVNHVFPLNEMEERTKVFAMSIGQQPTRAIGLMKKLTNLADTASMQDILEAEQITQSMMVTTADHLEGVSAFKEKRKPKFQGK